MQASTLLTFPRAERLLSTHPSSIGYARIGVVPRPQLHDRVLLAVGDGAALGDAIAAVSRLTRPCTGRVRVVHFRTWRSQPVAAQEPILARNEVFLETRHQGLDLTSALLDEFKRRGIRADGVMLESPPCGLGLMIARASHDWEAETIVLSDRPADGISDGIRAELAGSVSCPVAAVNGVLERSETADMIHSPLL